jgi:hypothetical protein
MFGDTGFVPFNPQYRLKFADGTVRWLLGKVLPERHANGMVSVPISPSANWPNSKFGSRQIFWTQLGGR